MALIKSISEIRAVMPRISSLSDSSTLPNLEKAAWKYLIPIISQELYDDLNLKYNASPGGELTTQEKVLIKHIQLPLAAYGLFDEMAFIHATITDNGIRTASTTQMQTAHRWEFNELKNALQDTALDGVEILLSYLFANKESFPLWTNSGVYAAQNSLLIKTSSDFSKQYKLFQPQRTYFQLKAIMADVEENYLISRLGRAVVSFIKSVDRFETVAGGSVVDIKAMLKKAVAFITISQACNHLAVDFSSNGFTVLSSGGNGENDTAGLSSADHTAISAKQEAANREGQNYLAKAAYYLQGIGENVFPNLPGAAGIAFTTVYNQSPLFVDLTSGDRPLLTNGNQRRRIFII